MIILIFQNDHIFLFHKVLIFIFEISYLILRIKNDLISTYDFKILK